MTLNALRLQETLADVGDPKEALWRELQLSLPGAIKVCREYAAKARASGETIIAPISIRRHPALAKEVQSLLGVDLYRALIEEHTGMFFGMMGCCAPCVGPSREAVRAHITWRRQLELQSNELYMC